MSPRRPRARWNESSYFCGVYAPGEYEIVVQSIVRNLAKRSRVETTRLEHDVDVSGRATRPEPRLRPSVGAVQQPTASSIRRHGDRLIGRDPERGVLDRLLDDVRGGASRALVVYGEAGMGKTALLEYLAGRASDCRVVSVAAAQAEMEFGFAALHQLCVPVLDHLDAVPEPQRKALQVTFGLGAGPVPERFLVGLAVLSLLAEAAAHRPLLCLIDDEQWLDQASAQVLAFVARRLGTESVGLVFGARTPSAELAGLPELSVGGLADGDARLLLGSVLTGPVDAADTRPDRHRGGRQPAGTVRASTGPDRGRTGGRVRNAGGVRATGQRRGELPTPGRSATTRRPAPTAGGRCRTSR